jgi:hypothetical protein
MRVRTRKLIGSMAIVGFLGLYMIAVATLAEHLPTGWGVQLVFFVVAGVSWGIPLIPLIAWMNRGGRG